MQCNTERFAGGTYCAAVNKIIFIRFQNKEKHIIYENVKH